MLCAARRRLRPVDPLGDSDSWPASMDRIARSTTRDVEQSSSRAFCSAPSQTEGRIDTLLMIRFAIVYLLASGITY